MPGEEKEPNAGIAFPAAVALIVALAGCERSPPEYRFSRAAFRADAIASCSSGMRMGGASVDVAERICGCGIDRFIAGKADAELDAMIDDEQRLGTTAGVQFCLAHESDLGYVPTGPTTPAADPEVVPPPEPPPAAPGVNAAAEPRNTGARSAEEEDREADQTGSAGGNDVGTTRWRQPPPRRGGGVR